VSLGYTIGVEYVSMEPRSPLNGLIYDLYYLDGSPPYSRLILPAAPSPLIIVNLGAPFLIRAGTRAETMEHVDGCAVTVPTRAWEFSYPNPTRTVGVHFRPWGLAPFLPMPTSDLCDRPATLEQIWSRQAVAELRYRLTLAETPHKMLKSLEDELMRQLRVIDGLELVRQVSTALAETGGRMPINDINAAARASSTYLAKRFKAVVGVTPKRLARSCRFTSTVLAIDVAASIEWSRIAADAGYFDQAHFVREFREFTGLTPTRYVEVRRQFTREYPEHILGGWPLPAD
jgi:AraC-like DNA-binding protein